MEDTDWSYIVSQTFGLIVLLIVVIYLLIVIGNLRLKIRELRAYIAKRDKQGWIGDDTRVP